MTVKHPAPFSDAIMPAIVQKLAFYSIGSTVLDPFAGTGRIHELQNDGYLTTGIEIEPEWADLNSQTRVGDARNLPFATRTFEAVVTSPCLEQGHRVLTEDLRWVPVGDVEVGDRLLAFDEHGPGVTATGDSRRRWRRTDVLRSVPRRTECLRVILANGDEIITTPEHPWLIDRHGRPDWLPSSDLMGFIPTKDAGRTYVLRLRELDISSRTIQAEKIQVVAVELAGLREIQEIETSEGTYFGEGYFHHNCYGNRMADHHNATDGSYRRTYKHVLGRDLTPGNSGAMQWGDEYRHFHGQVWRECSRVLADNGLLILNCKDHYRDGKRQHVTNWHYQTLKKLGLYLIDAERISTPGFRYGANSALRCSERLLTFRRTT